MNTKLRELNGIMGRISSAYHEAAVRMGISDSVRDIFYVLCDKGSGCLQSVLYKETGMTRSTVNTAIRRLEEKGILYLTHDVGKNTRVNLTESGEKIVKETVGRLVEIENEFFEKWTQEEQQMIIILNSRYADDLQHSLGRL